MTELTLENISEEIERFVSRISTNAEATVSLDPETDITTITVTSNGIINTTRCIELDNPKMILIALRELSIGGVDIHIDAHSFPYFD
jgi:hypothetical protein